MFRGQKLREMRRTLTICVAAGMLTGCATKGGKQAATAKPGSAADTSDIIDPDALAKPEARYKVTADLAPFFRFSPQQAAGPDQQLKKDTRVNVVGSLAGFKKVQLLPAGQFGYVDSADVTHLSSKEIADEDALYAAQHAPPAALTTPMTDANSTSIGNGGNYNPPPEAGSGQPLPVADPVSTPTPPPASIFRY